MPNLSPQDITKLASAVNTELRKYVDEVIGRLVSEEVWAAMRRMMEDKTDNEISAYIRKQVRAKVYVTVDVNNDRS